MKVISNKRLVLDELDKACERALEICGGTAESHAKKLCPVDTGNLRNSITHQAESSRSEAIGSAVEYSVYVELGHHQQPGRYVPAIGKRLVKDFVPGKPYLRPALENHQEEYKEIIEKELGANTTIYTTKPES